MGRTRFERQTKMNEKDLPQFLDNAMLFTSGNEFEAVCAFIEAPDYDLELLRKFKKEEREREELDLLKRVRKIIERK
jgi:hypothetical protein